MTDATICTHGTGYMETNFRLSLKEDGITYADHDRWMRLRLGCQAREVRSDGSVEFCGSHGSWGRIKSVDLGDDESLQLCERHWDALREWFHEDLERREQHLEAWTENVVRKEQEQRQRCHRCPAKKRRSTVYFIRRDGMVKIGFTTNMAQRMSALKPEVIETTLAGSLNHEALFHWFLSEHRVPEMKEWFYPEPLVEKVISLAKGATHARSVLRDLGLERVAP